MKPKQKTIDKLRDLILKSEGVQDERCQVCGLEHIVEQPHEKEYEPIKEGRILRALGENYSFCGAGVLRSYEGAPKRRDRWGLHNNLIQWTLCQPANQQEEETLLKLIDILTPKS